MTEFDFSLQGVTPTEIRSIEEDILLFAGAGFSDAIYVNDWNDSTHVKSAVGADLSSANTPNNNKFVSQVGGTGGDSQVSVNGGATQDLDTVIDSEAALHIQVTNEAAIEITGAIFFSYNGVAPATPVAGLSVKAAEVGDANFSSPNGNAAPLELTDQAANTTHDYYIVLSKGPTTPGLKQDKLRFEAVIT
jgi:hypothetical protein